MTRAREPQPDWTRTVRFVLGVVLMATALSACGKAQYDQEYWISRGSERIAIRFDRAGVDPQVAAVLSPGSIVCDAIVVRNAGPAPVTLDVYVFALGRVDLFGDLVQELKILVRNSPDKSAPGQVFPLGENVIVTGQWGVRQARIPPGRESYTCVSNFARLDSVDYDLSLSWLEDDAK